MDRLAIHPLTERGQRLEDDLNEARTDFQDDAALLTEYDLALTDHAIFTAEHGVSYRGDPIQVGVVITGLVRVIPELSSRNTGINTRLIVLEGYNNSPFKGAPKDCAEQRGMGMGDLRVGEMLRTGDAIMSDLPLVAWRALRFKLVASAIDGLNKDVNNYEAPTLHPCATPCKGKLVSHPAVSLETPFDSYAVDLATHSVVASESHTVVDFLRISEGVPVPDPTHVALRRN